MAAQELADECLDVARAILERAVAELMGAEADALCGAPYGGRSPERVNSRNGYRSRRWDTRAGTMELETPKLRTGSYFPVLHGRRRRQRLRPPGGSRRRARQIRGRRRRDRLSARSSRPGLSDVQLVISDAHPRWRRPAR